MAALPVAVTYTCPITDPIGPPTCSSEWARPEWFLVLINILRARDSERLGNLPQVTQSWALPADLFPSLGCSS